MKSKLKSILFSLVTLLAVIAILELCLAFASVLSPNVDQILLSPSAPFRISPIVSDERLGYRPNPAIPGHDSKGFRNQFVPARAKIVVFGDSQTYGVGVDARHAWVKQLENLLGETVYSMAYGGYGPVHSLILWNEASELNPDIYIEAFYAGNDLFDAFDMVYNRGQLPEFKTSSNEVKFTISKAEQADPILQRFSRIFRMGEDKKQTSKFSLVSIRQFIATHSKIYGLLRRAKHELYRRIPALENKITWEGAKRMAETRPDFCQIFDNGEFKTIFAPAYRLSALDLKDIRIAEGFRISREVIKRMGELASYQGKRFLVVLIPTKELVFKSYVDSPSANYRTLIQNEEEIWKNTRGFLKTLNIQFVDVLPALRNQLDRGIQPYPVTADGHPNQDGHQAIADIIYKEIVRIDKDEPRATRAVSGNIRPSSP